MKKLFLLLMIALYFNCYAQDKTADGLRHSLNIATTDSARCAASINLCYYYFESNRYSALYYAERWLQIAKRNNQWDAEAEALQKKSTQYRDLNQYAQALACIQLSFKIADDPDNRTKKTWSISNANTYQKKHLSLLSQGHLEMGWLMGATGDTLQQIIHFKTSASLAEKIGDKFVLGLVAMGLGSLYIDKANTDSALLLEKKAENYFIQAGVENYMGYCYTITAYNHLHVKHDPKRFLQDIHKAVAFDLKTSNLASLGDDYAGVANFYIGRKKADSSLYYSKKMFEALHIVLANDLGDTYQCLYKSYQLTHQTDSAYKYLALALSAKNSKYDATIKSLNNFQKLAFKDQLRLQAVEKEKDAIQTKIRTYVMLSGIGVFMLLAGIFYRNNRQKQKANKVLEGALTNLKTTQTQLIQSEKMASLGELTAGIAHEIQNPLNFVNNFSEVNKELLLELKEELTSENYKEVAAIADDVIANEEKINHHGKRADSIVKGMLEHSRASTGKKEPSDLNALADEYLRLSYHGLRAKDRSFNAEMVTNLDPGLPKVNVIPQDMGRVLLNLFNNAFYAVYQKQKSGNPEYKPIVSVKTSAENGHVVIKVKDNGIGIPDAIKEKIMQPFFTTKPTGEGTGLGLSLSYDIVVKGHGGNIEVNTKNGGYTEFIVTLPLT